MQIYRVKGRQGIQVPILILFLLVILSACSSQKEVAREDSIAGQGEEFAVVTPDSLAPALPLDSNAPFLHLERKFMHLGFHIYDVGFQSPNVEAARPLVYATALLLVVVIVLLNLVAIQVRNRLSERYRGLES